MLPWRPYPGRTGALHSDNRWQIFADLGETPTRNYASEQRSDSSARVEPAIRSQACQYLPLGCSPPALLQSNDDGLLCQLSRRRGGADEFHAEPHTIRILHGTVVHRAGARRRPSLARPQGWPVQEQAPVARQAGLTRARPLPDHVWRRQLPPWLGSPTATRRER
jgi:hypothetical protein